MILDRVTLKQGKTHCIRALTTDPITHVVTDVDAVYDQNQLSDAESIEIRVRLTSKYGRRVLLATYTGYFWFVSLLDKEIRS